MTPLMIFGSTALPALLAGLVCAVVFRVWRKQHNNAASGGSGGGWRHGAVGASLAVGVVISICFVQEKMLALPSMKMSIEWWVAYWAVFCAAASIVRGARDWPLGQRLIGLGVLCLIASGVVVYPLMRSEWFSIGEGIAWIGGIGVWMFAVCWMLERSGREAPAFGSAALLHVFAGAAAPAVLLWNNQTFSKVLGAIAGATLAVGVLAVWRRRVALSHGSAAVGGVLACAATAAGYLYGYPSGPGGGALAGGLLAGMFLTPMTGWMPGIRDTKPWIRLTVQMLAATILGAAALGVAIAYGDINELLELMGVEIQVGSGS